MPNSITSWDVLEDSFAKKFIPKVHSYVFVDVLNVVPTHPLPYGSKIMKSPILKKNLIKEWMKFLSQVMLLKRKMKIPNYKKKIQSPIYSI
jgi:hypothetical protein